MPNPRLRLALAALAALTVAVLTGAFVVSAASTAQADAEPVLGSPTLYAPHGAGWGTARPHHLDNGGDPAGMVVSLTWKHWGSATATGRGLTYLFRPGGGYYAKSGRIILRAESLGTCPDGTYGYTRLEYRVAHRPGATPTKRWHPWAQPGGDVCSR